MKYYLPSSQSQLKYCVHLLWLLHLYAVSCFEVFKLISDFLERTIIKSYSALSLSFVLVFFFWGLFISAILEQFLMNFFEFTFWNHGSFVFTLRSAFLKLIHLFFCFFLCLNCATGLSGLDKTMLRTLWLQSLSLSVQNLVLWAVWGTMLFHSMLCHCVRKFRTRCSWFP